MRTYAVKAPRDRKRRNLSNKMRHIEQKRRPCIASVPPGRQRRLLDGIGCHLNGKRATTRQTVPLLNQKQRLWIQYPKIYQIGAKFYFGAPIFCIFKHLPSGQAPPPPPGKRGAMVPSGRGAPLRKVLHTCSKMESAVPI